MRESPKIMSESKGQVRPQDVCRYNYLKLYTLELTHILLDKGTIGCITIKNGIRYLQDITEFDFKF